MADDFADIKSAIAVCKQYQLRDVELVGGVGAEMLESREGKPNVQTTKATTTVSTGAKQRTGGIPGVSLIPAPAKTQTACLQT